MFPIVGFAYTQLSTERVMQTGKKKLVLDHLIVQNMDDNEGEKDVHSILLFGAQALFEQGDAQSAKDIHCKRSVQLEGDDLTLLQTPRTISNILSRRQKRKATSRSRPLEREDLSRLPRSGPQNKMPKIHPTNALKRMHGHRLSLVSLRNA